MKNYVSGKNDFAQPTAFDLTGLIDRNDVGTWEWRFISPTSNVAMIKCSDCGNGESYPTWYCPNCGAIMVNTKSMIDMVHGQVDARLAYEKEENSND